MKRILSAVAGLVILLAAVSASAVPMVPSLTLDDGSTVITVQDGSALDASNLPGWVSFTGNIGKWAVSINNGFGQIGANVPSMHLSSIDLMVLGSGSLTITLSETLTQPWNAPGAQVSAGGVFGTLGSEGSFVTRINGNPYSTLDFNTAHGLSFSGDDAFSYASTGNDLIELVATFSSPFTALGITSFDYAISPVPEPGTFLLFGSAVLALAIYSKRRVCADLG